MGRSREFDNPTAYIAIRHVLKEQKSATCYYASPEEVQRYKGFVFQPDKPITDSNLRRIQYAAAIAAKKKESRL